MVCDRCVVEWSREWWTVFDALHPLLRANAACPRRATQCARHARMWCLRSAPVPGLCFLVFSISDIWPFAHTGLRPRCPPRRDCLPATRAILPVAPSAMTRLALAPAARPHARSLHSSAKKQCGSIASSSLLGLVFALATPLSTLCLAHVGVPSGCTDCGPTRTRWGPRCSSGRCSRAQVERERRRRHLRLAAPGSLAAARPSKCSSSSWPHSALASSLGAVATPGSFGRE